MNCKKMISILAATAILAGGLLIPESVVKADGIPLTEEYFDPSILIMLTETIDHDNLGILDANEAAQVTEISLFDEEIYSLKGIEYLTSLHTLSIQGCAMSYLDLSLCPSVNTVMLNEVYDLASVGFENNDNLEKLYIVACPDLTDIDVSGASQINELVAEGNGETNLIDHADGNYYYGKMTGEGSSEDGNEVIFVFSESLTVNFTPVSTGDPEENEDGENGEGAPSGSSENGGGSTSSSSGSSSSGNTGSVGGSSSGSTGSVGGTTTTSSSSSGVEGFVERLYTMALGRRSDPEGKRSWIDAINCGGVTGADAARGFLYSNEFYNRECTYGEFVETLYRVFFDRDPDQAGFNAWCDALYRGADKGEVIEGFINSVEWANVCARFGIASGSEAMPTVEVVSSQGTLDFCARLYSTCLGREPDGDGLRAWARQLTLGVESGESVARGFFFSGEFESKNFDNTEFVARLYRTFMGREPDAAGFNAWVGQLEAGVSREEVFMGFSQSNEFIQICNSYGIRAFFESGAAMG